VYVIGGAGSRKWKFGNANLPIGAPQIIRRGGEIGAPSIVSISCTISKLGHSPGGKTEEELQ